MASKFQVIIVGGGVAGLLLANALEKAEVNYVLLEGKSEFAPAVGASIALGANGNRILDQLGCCKFSEQTALACLSFAMLAMSRYTSWLLTILQMRSWSERPSLLSTYERGRMGSC